MPTYLALLRGINVGGKSQVRMSALKASFEANGFEDVATFIQSGNVLFTAHSTPAAELTRRIEAMLGAGFAFKPTVVVRSRRQMRAVVDDAPRGFGAQPTRYRYDVLFLKPPLTAAVALKSAPTKPGVDEASPGPGVLFFSRVTAKASQSRLSRIISTPIYPSVTIRNWNTTTKLLSLMEERP